MYSDMTPEPCTCGAVLKMWSSHSYKYCLLPLLPLFALSNSVTLQ